MKRQTKAEKLTDARIEAAYRRSCSGVQIDIMKIGSVFEHGRKLIAGGHDDVALAAGLREFVDTL